eukprot:jgi/Tetstr1/444820/TSEL_032662.t1
MRPRARELTPPVSSSDVDRTMAHDAEASDEFARLPTGGAAATYQIGLEKRLSGDGAVELEGGGETSETDRVFASLAYDRFLKPKAPVASSDCDALHRAFINKTHEVSLMARAKAAAGAAFAHVTPDKPNPNLKPDPKSPKKQPTAPKQ